MSEIHGQKNAATRWAAQYNQKEATASAEERLKAEITKYNFYNTDRKHN